MSRQATHSELAPPPFLSDVREAARTTTGYWWVSLVSGIAWVVISLVLLQFDEASVTTVGVLVGFMFLFAGAQNVALATARVGALRFVAGMFGVLFFGAAVVSFANPGETVEGLAEILGFLFLLVGLWWMSRAFLERSLNPLWWLGLISGILMTGLAFWTAGQFLFEKVYVLLVFAGIWALMQGINEIARAFEIRRVHEEL